jgi:hypothetical protein
MNAPIVIAGFPIDSNVSLRKIGTHRDVRYEVSNHGRNPEGHRGEEGTYCYYVTIFEDMVPGGVFDEHLWLSPNVSSFGRVSYDYMSASFADVEWNYGVTFYEKLCGHDGEPRGVKLGCDYAHAWDRCSYTLGEVEADARRTVDALCDRYGIYRRCPWNGRWLPQAEMVEHNGRLYSPEAYSERFAKATGEQA